jgi:hypothetical protein
MLPRELLLQLRLASVVAPAWLHLSKAMQRCLHRDQTAKQLAAGQHRLFPFVKRSRHILPP